jgi:diguanylate cyclase (GGDEF)-like protein
MNSIIPPECQDLQTENQNLKEEITSLLEQIQAWTVELKRRNLESDVLNRMGYMLQRCQSVEDLQSQLGQYLFRLFMDQPGEIFLINENKQVLEKASTWGDIHSDPVLLRKEYCQSLASNQICSFKDSGSTKCQYHLTLVQGIDQHNPYICAPINFQERVIGILHQHLPEVSPLMQDNSWLNTEHWEHLAGTVAERLASTFTNLKLRERLRPQTLRDPLTQLFNRWYMEETLEREIHYAQRHQTPLWVYTMDVDRMKNVNDRHGYDVGDEILRKLSAYIKRHIRAEDVASRSGGDEFTLILLGMPDNAALNRADRLRQGVRDLQVKTYDLLPVGTTASFGLASFPHHGGTAAELLRAADNALHKAKSGGRDAVMVA